MVQCVFLLATRVFYPVHACLLNFQQQGGGGEVRGGGGGGGHLSEHMGILSMPTSRGLGICPTRNVLKL